MNKPHWEHGYRCHGYWLDVFDGVIWQNKRIGWVGLQPYCGGRGNVKDNGYSWGVVDPRGGGYIEGHYRTLRAAKRRVERECVKLYPGTGD